MFSATFCLQVKFEVFSQFFVGVFDSSENYYDDFRLIISRNVTSLAFWFDCATSLPWSFLDLNVYQVSFVMFYISVIVHEVKDSDYVRNQQNFIRNHFPQKQQLQIWFKSVLELHSNYS